MEDSPPSQQFLNLPCGCLGGARVVHREIRPAHLVGQGQLVTFPSRHLLRGPPPLLCQPPQPLRTGGMNIDDSIANIIPSRLQHYRRIEHNEIDRRIVIRLRRLFAEAPLDLGKQQCFEGPTLGRVGEHLSPDPPATNFAVFIQHILAPSGGRLLP